MQTWSVTRNGLPVSDAMASKLIASAIALGMHTPENDQVQDDYDYDLS